MTKVISFTNYYQVRTFQIIIWGKRTFLTFLLVGRIDLKIVLYNIILQCILDNKVNILL
jgi:hypothetical protein